MVNHLFDDQIHDLHDTVPGGVSPLHFGSKYFVAGHGTFHYIILVFFLLKTADYSWRVEAGAYCSYDMKKYEFNRPRIWSNYLVVYLAFLIPQKYQMYFTFLDYSGFEYRLGVHCPFTLTGYYPRYYCVLESNSDFNNDSCTIVMLHYADKDIIHAKAQFSLNHLVIDSRAEPL
ncbi:hypothetical protein BDA99DRAFT_538666 [Phascolomyces articulosus]|uniref:Uncharacterized protein n=1 Tax=Phascolomyces articulosus TaxID=60185 RepID=A0AAD5JX70_9FUNG|nr:hypothetical protein BDA99DRAFT_538666 [Phascolomyces articulosus]